MRPTQRDDLQPVWLMTHVPIIMHVTRLCRSIRNIYWKIWKLLELYDQCLAMLWVERLHVYICTKCTKLSRPSTDRFVRGFQSLVEKLSGRKSSDSFLFSINESVCRHVAFYVAGCEAKVTSLNLSPTQERVQNERVNFSIAAHLSYCWKMWWRLAWRSWRYREHKKLKNEN